MSPEQKARVQLLVDSLRSGKFKQTTGTLAQRSDDGKRIKYCCLGVAIEVARANGCEVSRDKAKPGDYYSYDKRPDTDPDATDGAMIGNESDLPDVVMQWYGFESTDPTLDVNPDALRPAIRDTYEHEVRFIGIARRAASCNDVIRMNFTEIAAAFENTFLTDADS